MLASCTSQQAAEATAVHTIEKQVILNESLEIFETLPTCSAIDYTISEPDIKKGMGATQDIVFYRDGNPIYGKITHPKGKGPFKTIIISSGLYAPLGRYSNKVRIYAEKGYAVIEFQFQNGEAPETYADPEYCLAKAKKRGAFGGKTTMKYIEETNKYRADYYKYYTGHDWNDCRYYDLCLNSGAIGFEGCVKAIKEYIKIRFPEYKNDAL